MDAGSGDFAYDADNIYQNPTVTGNKMFFRFTGMVTVSSAGAVTFALRSGADGDPYSKKTVVTISNSGYTYSIEGTDGRTLKTIDFAAPGTYDITVE